MNLDIPRDLNLEIDAIDVRVCVYLTDLYDKNKLPRGVYLKRTQSFTKNSGVILTELRHPDELFNLAGLDPNVYAYFHLLNIEDKLTFLQNHCPYVLDHAETEAREAEYTEN